MEEIKQNGVAPVPEKVETAAPTNVRTVGAMTEMERLRVENVSLRAENLMLRKERMKKDADAIQSEEEKIQKEIFELRGLVAARLGVQPDKVRFRRDGMVEEVI